MIDLNNIKNYTLDKPPSWTLLGSKEDFENLPASHKEQIFFLNEEASDYIHAFSSAANLITGGGWDPFAKGNFKTVEVFNDFRGIDESRQPLKKWLFNRGIPFRGWVYILSDVDHPIIATWKMVIKYSDRFFSIGDVMVFDNSINWCLFFYHEDQLFFGKDSTYDSTDDEVMMKQLNERKEKYPNFKHPFL